METSQPTLSSEKFHLVNSLITTLISNQRCSKSTQEVIVVVIGLIEGIVGVILLRAVIKINEAAVNKIKIVKEIVLYVIGVALEIGNVVVNRK